MFYRILTHKERSIPEKSLSAAGKSQSSNIGRAMVTLMMSGGDGGGGGGGGVLTRPPPSPSLLSFDYGQLLQEMTYLGDEEM